MKDFPPKLQKLATFIEENYGFKSIKNACELSGLNYDSIQVMISKSRKKGNDFNDFLYELLDKRNRKRLMFVDDKVYEKALKGDTQAAKLYYQRTGELKSGSGGDRTNIQINFIQPAQIPHSEVLNVTESDDSIGSIPQHIVETDNENNG